MAFDNPYIPNVDNILSQHQRGLATGQHMREQSTLSEAGERFAQGDQTGTVNALAKGGQLDAAMAMRKEFEAAASRAETAKLEKANRFNTVLGNLALSIKNLPPDAQPHAWANAVEQARKTGMQVGEEFDDFGMLDVVLARAGETKTAIDQELARRKLGAGAKPTAGIQEYEFAMQQRQAQGLPPISFEEYKKSSKAPLVEITGEKSYDKTRGEAIAKDYGQVQQEAQGAVSRIGQLRQIDSLLSDPNVYTGTGAQSINALKRAGQTLLGMDIKGVESADAARRITSEMALSLKDDLPGPLSNPDREFLLSIPPSIGDTAAGRKLLVELMIAKEERKVEIAQLARQYAQQHGGRLDDGWYSVLAQHNEQNPVFTDEMMESARGVASRGKQQSPAAGVLPKVTDVKSYNAVQPGARYIDPEGRIKTKGGGR
jgi:hypothetical protein